MEQEAPAPSAAPLMPCFPRCLACFLGRSSYSSISSGVGVVSKEVSLEVFLLFGFFPLATPLPFLDLGASKSSSESYSDSVSTLARLGILPKKRQKRQ